MSSLLLERVRDAFTHTERPDPARAFRPRAVRPGVVELFAERVTENGGEVHRCGPADVEDTLLRVLRGRATVVPEGFPWAVPHPVPARGLEAAALDRVRAVVTTVTLAVATAGSMVLTHGDGQGPRALTLVPETHVCVVLADQLVLGVPDAVAALDPHGPQTWVSGQVSTGDIELDQVEQRRGARRLHVVLVEEAA